jgi:hypothetical protein
MPALFWKPLRVQNERVWRGCPGTATRVKCKAMSTLPDDKEKPSVHPFDRWQSLVLQNAVLTELDVASRIHLTALLHQAIDNQGMKVDVWLVSPLFAREDDAETLPRAIVDGLFWTPDLCPLSRPAGCTLSTCHHFCTGACQR